MRLACQLDWSKQIALPNDMAVLPYLVKTWIEG